MTTSKKSILFRISILLIVFMFLCSMVPIKASADMMVNNVAYATSFPNNGYSVPQSVTITHSTTIYYAAATGTSGSTCTLHIDNYMGNTIHTIDIPVDGTNHSDSLVLAAGTYSMYFHVTGTVYQCAVTFQ